MGHFLQNLVITSKYPIRKESGNGLIHDIRSDNPMHEFDEPNVLSPWPCQFSTPCFVPDCWQSETNRNTSLPEDASNENYPPFLPLRIASEIPHVPRQKHLVFLFSDEANEYPSRQDRHSDHHRARWVMQDSLLVVLEDTPEHAPPIALVPPYEPTQVLHWEHRP